MGQVRGKVQSWVIRREVEDGWVNLGETDADSGGAGGASWHQHRDSKNPDSKRGPEKHGPPERESPTNLQVFLLDC